MIQQNEFCIDPVIKLKNRSLFEQVFNLVVFKLKTLSSTKQQVRFLLSHSKSKAQSWDNLRAKL